MAFAFGKADTTRNGTQSAADSAALAAAQQARDQLKPEIVAHLADATWLEGIFSGVLQGVFNGCGDAQRFASINDAGQVLCNPLFDGRWGYYVKLTSNKSMGKSIIPGTETKHATSQSTAIVDSRCHFVPSAGQDPTGSPGVVICPEFVWHVDPTQPETIPTLADLFDVHLVEN